MRKCKKVLALSLAVMMMFSMAFTNGNYVFAAGGIEESSIYPNELSENDETGTEESCTESAGEEPEIITEESESEEPEVKTEESESDETEIITEESESEETETITDNSETELENTPDLNAVEETSRLFAELPSGSELENLSEEEREAFIEQYYAALDAYDSMSDEERASFEENYPELYRKVFTDIEENLDKIMDMSDISAFSMIPLEERKAYLVLNGYSDEELKAVPVSTILSSIVDADGNAIEIPEDATAVWSYFKNEENDVIRDEYHVIDKSETVDMTAVSGLTTYTMELIVGSGKQLDANNIRYIVKVYLTSQITERLTYSLYAEDESGNRSVAPYTRNWLDSSQNLSFFNNMTISVIHYCMGENAGNEYYFSINSEASEHPYLDVRVYTMWEYAMHLWGLGGNPITDQILNQDMTKTGAGYKGTYTEEEHNIDASLTGDLYFIVAYFDKETGAEISGATCISPSLDVDYSQLYFDIATVDGHENPICRQEDNTDLNMDDMQLNPDGTMDGDGVHEYYFMFKEGYSEEDEYYCKIRAHGNTYGDDANSYVVKAVEGAYASLADASEAEDIKDQLFPYENYEECLGYKTSFGTSKGGQRFTAFFEDGNVWDILIVGMDYDPRYDEEYVRTYTDAPIVGEEDPWFRVTGARQNGKELDCYVVENGKSVNMDTMYGYGYQTIFINDPDVDLSALQPVFWLANESRIEAYVDGRKIQSGDTVDFSSGSVLFSVIIDNHVKNYLVSVYKKEAGPKLYVSGPETHEVFLDEYFEYKHDIMVANLGDQPLTGLRVELNAENCKLDDYWTIGGENNDTLAPFDTTSSNSSYSELANISKIRLIPDGDGEIEGTLTVYADGQEPVTINLTGRAQNPVIITTALDDAVKYVPYSYLVTTNNMYDWTSVKMSLTGELPEGVNFYPETGEIYGVPQEMGSFDIEITAEFTSDTYEFESSTVKLTLTVLENTNENVYHATDEGYGILDPIGVDMGGYDFVLSPVTDENAADGAQVTYGDVIFRSEGVLDEFVDLWLNGEKLVKGVDYDAESGSTKITIYAETIDGKSNTNGSNTIAAEFRTTDTGSLNNSDNTNELKKTSQNYRVETSCSHTYNSGVVTKAATCTTSGVKTYTCTKCGATKTETIPATGHSYNSGVITKEATCTETGVKTYTCTKCGAVKTETIAAKGHTTKTTVTAATCTQNGSSVTKCTVCGAITETQVIPATGHSYTSKITKEAGCTEDGERTYTCANCGDHYTETIPAIGHSYTSKITKEAGCTEAGIRTYTCNNCGSSYTESIPATGHDYVSEITKEATETEDGERTYTCTNCHDSFTEVIPALGGKDHIHEYDEGVVTKEATCMEMGERTYTCTICGESYTEVILAAGHSYDEGVVTKEATCTEMGEKTYTCTICGESYSEVILAMGHSYDEGVTEKEAACTENGTVKYTCKNCGETYTKVIEAVGHVYDNGTIIKEPTYTETGIRQYTCQNCGDTYTEVVPVAENTNAGSGTGESGTNGNGSSVTNGIRAVTCKIYLVDASGNPITDLILELHSKPQSAVLKSDGSVEFSTVEFGSHTLYLKDKNGVILAARKITLKEGKSFHMDGNVITAIKGGILTLKVQYHDGELTILSAEGVVNPHTGDTADLLKWNIIMLMAFAAAGMVFVFTRKRKQNA